MRGATVLPTMPRLAAALSIAMLLPALVLGSGTAAAQPTPELPPAPGAEPLPGEPFPWAPGPAVVGAPCFRDGVAVSCTPWEPQVRGAEGGPGKRRQGTSVGARRMLITGASIHATAWGASIAAGMMGNNQVVSIPFLGPILGMSRSGITGMAGAGYAMLSGTQIVSGVMMLVGVRTLRDGDPEESVRDANSWILGGSIGLLGTWLTCSIAGFSAVATSFEKDHFGRLAIPVAGPFLEMGRPELDPAVAATFGVLGGGQLVALGVVATGVVLRVMPAEAARARSGWLSSLSAAPMALPGGGGLAVSGEF